MRKKTVGPVKYSREDGVSGIDGVELPYEGRFVLLSPGEGRDRKSAYTAHIRIQIPTHNGNFKLCRLYSLQFY